MACRRVKMILYIMHQLCVVCRVWDGTDWYRVSNKKASESWTREKRNKNLFMLMLSRLQCYAVVCRQAVGTGEGRTGERTISRGRMDTFMIHFLMPFFPRKSR